MADASRAVKRSASEHEVKVEKKVATGKQEKNDVDEDEETFIASIENAACSLRENGYAIVPNVMSEEECDANQTRLWEFVMKVSEGRVKRDDPTTWKDWIYSTHSILQHFGIGHSRVCWSVRLCKRVHQVFAEIYGTDQLTVSFDGATIQPEYERMGGYWPSSGKGWDHSDQSPYTPKRRCIQGMVIFRAWNRGDAGIQVRPGSQRVHKDLVGRGIAPVRNVKNKETGEVRVVPDKSNWIKFARDDLDAIDNAYVIGPIKLEAPRGSLILWDSRTFHAGTLPHPSRAVPNERGAAYVCMQPDAWMTKKDRADWLDAAMHNRTTSHWPIKRKLFSLGWQTYGQPQPSYTTPEPERDDNDPVVRKLICMDTYGATGLLGWTEDRAPLLTVYSPYSKK